MRFHIYYVFAVSVALLAFSASAGDSCATICTRTLPVNSTNVDAVSLLLQCHSQETLCCYIPDYNVPFASRNQSSGDLSGCWSSDGTPVTDNFNGLMTVPPNSPCYYSSDADAAATNKCSFVIVPTSTDTFSSLNFTGTVENYTSTFNSNGAWAPLSALSSAVVVLALLAAMTVATF